MKRFALIFVFSLAMFGSLAVPHISAQQGATPTPDDSGDEASYTAVDVAHSASLDKIRADLMSSHALWASGDYKSAAAHAADANADFNAILSDLAAQNLDAQLKTVLDAYTALAGQSGTASKIDDAFQAAMDNLDTVEQTLIGPNMTDVEFQGVVTVQVLQLIEMDYQQAVKDGKIVDPASYQVAAALLVLTQSRWDSITTGVEELDDAATIKALFDTLGKDLPDIVKLPAKLATPDELNKTTDALIAAIQSSLQLPQATEAATPDSQ